MKNLMIGLLFSCVILIIIAILSTLKLNKLKKKYRKNCYSTPKLSNLHGKEFANYMDYLTEAFK